MSKLIKYTMKQTELIMVKIYVCFIVCSQFCLIKYVRSIMFIQRDYLLEAHGAPKTVHGPCTRRGALS